MHTYAQKIINFGGKTRKKFSTYRSIYRCGGSPLRSNLIDNSKITGCVAHLAVTREIKNQIRWIPNYQLGRLRPVHLKLIF